MISLLLLASVAWAIDSDPPETGRPLEPELLARLRQGADEHAEAALRFTCRENLWRDDSPTEVRRSDYLLVTRRDGRLVERRFPRKRGSRPETPFAYEWLSLFSSTVSSQMAFFLISESELEVRIYFRGALPYEEGHRLGEWEGIATVERTSGDLLEVRARPRNQPERYEALVDKHRRRMRLILFRFEVPLDKLYPGPRAEKRFVVARFRRRKGLLLPLDVETERIRFTRGREKKEREIRGFDRCRRYDASGEATLPTR